MAHIPKTCSCRVDIPFYRSLWRCPGCGRYICGLCKKSMDHVENGATLVLKGAVPFVALAAPELAPVIVVAGSKSFMPGHDYLLIEQGVHIGEFHYLEDLARDKVYEFCYIATVNKIKGTTAGFCMRPIAIR